MNKTEARRGRETTDRQTQTPSDGRVASAAPEARTAAVSGAGEPGHRGAREGKRISARPRPVQRAGGAHAGRRGRAGEKGRGEAGRLRLEAREGPAGFQERVPTGGRGRAVGCSLSVPGLCCMDQVGGSRNSLEPPPRGQMSQEAAETSAGVGSHVHSALLSGPWPTPWHQPRQPRCPAKTVCQCVPKANTWAPRGPSALLHSPEPSRSQYSA